MKLEDRYPRNRKADGARGYVLLVVVAFFALLAFVFFDFRTIDGSAPPQMGVDPQTGTTNTPTSPTQIAPSASPPGANGG